MYKLSGTKINFGGLLNDYYQRTKIIRNVCSGSLTHSGSHIAGCRVYPPKGDCTVPVTIATESRRTNGSMACSDESAFPSP